jgi:CBS domain-containing protein
LTRTDTVASVLKTKGRQVYSVPPSTSVYDALEMMAAREIGALLVMEQERLVGLVSERDYARKVILQGRSSRDTSVSEIMSTDLVTVTCQTSVDECMKLMTDYRVRHLPVVESGDVAAVVSLGDLVKWVISVQEAEIQQLQAYIAGSYTV